MSLSVDLIKYPYEISFSGCPIPFMFGVSPYTSAERIQDIRLSVRFEIEEQFGSNIFIERRNESYAPDGEGKIYFDASGIIDAYLNYYTPKSTTILAKEAIEQRKRFRIIYLLQRNNVAVTQPVTSDNFFAIKGGMSYDNFEPVKFFTQHIEQNRNPLNYFIEKEMVLPSDIKYLWWIYTNADKAGQTIEFKLFLDDGTTASKTIVGLSVGKWGICCVAVGFLQQGLDLLVPNGRYCIRYMVSITANNNDIINAPFFYLEYRNFYNTYQLAYRSSTGALDTITLKGKVDFEAEYDKQLATKTNAPEWYKDLNLKAQTNSLTPEELMKFKGDTGFISKKSLDRLRDLFLSIDLYEFAGNKFVPIFISPGTAKFYANRDSLFSAQIEWKRAYVNNFYTPNLFSPSACPAVDRLIVKQRNKKFLHVMYAIPSPYDKIEFTIDNGNPSELQTFIKTGNSGSFIVAFSNPATNIPVQIDIKARVICDEDSDPVDYGPYTTVHVNASGDSLPIATDDYFAVAAGGSTITLTGSVLSNDYDPDGDPIEVYPIVNGVTNAGGVCNINSAGVVTYTAPTSSFNGNDFIEYEIQQNGLQTGVKAKCYFSVGATIYGVFAKLVLRNVSSYYNSYDASQSGEVWADFFSDPAGTIPLDITSYNLTIHVLQIERIQDEFGVITQNQTALTFPGLGNKIKIFEGNLFRSSYDLSWQYPRETSLQFIIQNGAGYGYTVI